MGRGQEGKGLLCSAEVKEGEWAGKTAARAKIASAVRVAVGAHQRRGVVRTPIAGGYELAAVSSPASVIPKEVASGSRRLTASRGEPRRPR